MPEIGQASFQQVDVASASTVDLSAVTQRKVRITGTTNINTITMKANQELLLTFAGILTLASGIGNLPNGAAAIPTAAGDTCVLTADASAVVTVWNYQRKGGTPVALVDPNADRISFWDDSAGKMEWLQASTGLDITGTALTVTWATPGSIGSGTPAAGAFTTLSASGDTTLGDGSADVVTVNAGWILQPNMVAFAAVPSADADDQTGDGTDYTVILATEIYDRGNDFNGATGTLTAPVTGIYDFSVTVRMHDLTVATHAIIISLVTSNRTYAPVSEVATATDQRFFFSIVGADMDVGDTAHIVVDVLSGTKVVDINSAVTRFAGHLVG